MTTTYFNNLRRRLRFLENHVVADKVALETTGRLDVDKVVGVGIFQNGFRAIVLGGPLQVLHRLVNAREKVLRAHREGLLALGEVEVFGFVVYNVNRLGASEVCGEKGRPSTERNQLTNIETFLLCP